MTQPLNDYFVLEAGEYLEQLERLLASPTMPPAEQLLRLARGVRGSARMAGAETIAGVAERLEDAARSIASQNIAWSDEIRALTAQTVRDLQILLRALNRWGPAEEQRVREAIERWDEIESDGAAADGRPVVAIETLFHDDAGPHLLSGPEAPPADGPPLPIESLLFEPEAALREAIALRPEVERSLRGEAGARPLDELVAELFDLLALAAVGVQRSG